MSLDLKAGLTRLALAVTAKPGDKPKIADEQRRKATEAEDAEKAKKAGAQAKEAHGIDKTPKKATPKPKKGDDALHCPSCGSAGPWTISSMTLVVLDVPCTKLSKTGEGHVYDDTKGDSQGWQPSDDPMVKCNKCGNEANVNELQEMAEGEGGGSEAFIMNPPAAAEKK